MDNGMSRIQCARTLLVNANGNPIMIIMAILKQMMDLINSSIKIKTLSTSFKSVTNQDERSTEYPVFKI